MAEYKTKDFRIVWNDKAEAYDVEAVGTLVAKKILRSVSFDQAKEWADWKQEQVNVN